MVPTNMQKEKAENTEEETGEKDRGRKDSREISTQKILKVKESIWEERIGKNVYQQAMEPCDRVEREICAKEGESVFTVKRRKRRDTSIHRKSTVKEIYLMVKITRPYQSILQQRRIARGEWYKTIVI